MKLGIISGFILASGIYAPVSFAAATGEWYTDCTAIKENGVTVYHTAYYQFNADGTFSQEDSVFQDKKCNKLFILNTFEGTYNEVAGSKHTNMNMTLEKHYFTFSALLDPLMAMFNKSSFCGYTDWAVDVKKEVTGKVCKFKVLGMDQEFPTLMKPEALYTIYGREKGNLFFGEITDKLDGSTEAKRPTALDMKVPYMPL